MTPPWLANVELHEFSAVVPRFKHRQAACGECGASTAVAFDAWCLRKSEHEGDHSAVIEAAARMDRYAELRTA